MDALRSFLSGRRLAIIGVLLAIPFVFFGSSTFGTVFTNYGKVNGLIVSALDVSVAVNTVTSRLQQIYGDDFTTDTLEDGLLNSLVRTEIISQKALLYQVLKMNTVVSEDDAKRLIMQKINELQLAKELIKFPSITPIDAGVMKFLEKKLKKLGFKTKILEFREKNSKPIKNLYAKIGTKGPNFCYAGHLDVVPPGNIKDWTINPFKPSIKKGHLIGRGANDMKSSIAAFVSAASFFLAKNNEFNGSISLLITGDEEGDAINGTKKVVD